jgi:drug/metabolite transporter (DMT)-like permease
MTWAQRHLDITIASLITLASPVVSTVLAWWIYDEVLTPVQGVGAAIVLGALALLVAGERGPVALDPDDALSGTGPVR